MERTTIIGHIDYLPMRELKILKVIRIIGPDWNPFTAYLPYTRTFNSEKFDSKTGHDAGDILDSELLSVIQQSYPRSVLYRNRLMIFKGQLEDELTRIQGGVMKPATIRFHPQISYDNIEELIGRTFPAMEIELNLRVQLFSGNEKLNYIYSDFICELPHEQLVSLSETIQSV